MKIGLGRHFVLEGKGIAFLPARPGGPACGRRVAEDFIKQELKKMGWHYSAASGIAKGIRLGGCSFLRKLLYLIELMAGHLQIEHTKH